MLRALEEFQEMAAQRGADQTTILHISNLIKNLDLSPEAAMDALGATEHQREVYWEEVRKQHANSDGTHPDRSVF